MRSCNTVPQTESPVVGSLVQVKPPEHPHPSVQSSGLHVTVQPAPKLLGSVSGHAAARTVQTSVFVWPAGSICVHS